MREWRWIGLDLILAIHDRQIAEHGGLDGVRDRGAIESALARPQNQALYQQLDVADLAAAYAYGLSCGNGFADGNKRTTWIAMRLFLADNGFRLRFEPFEAIRNMQSLAAGTLSEVELAEWIRERI
jgi:death-on-curing protein